MAQFARPDSDVSNAGGWAPTPLWDQINEATADDDTTKVTSGNNPGTADTFEVGLTDVTDPTDDTGHIIRFRHKQEGGARTSEAKAQLYQGATLIAETTSVAPGTIWTTTSYTLAAVGEADQITDYTDLRIRVVPNTTGTGSPATHSVTWAELEVPTAPVIVGLATETDTGLTVSRVKTGVVGLGNETDTAFAVGRLKIETVGLTTETDSAFAAVPERTLAVGLSSETDTAFPVTTPGQTVIVGLATETDSGFAVSRLKAKAVGLPVETATAFTVAKSKLQAVGLASETDAAFAVGKAKAETVGLSIETDAGLAVTRRKLQAVGLATETDSALVVARLKTQAVGQSAETDVALAARPNRLIAVGLPAESDTALAVGSAKVALVGLVSEIDVGLSITRQKTQLLGLTTELDTTFSAVPVPDFRPFVLGAPLQSISVLDSGRSVTLPAPERETKI